MIKAEDFKWLDRVYHLFHLGSNLCLSGELTDCFLPFLEVHGRDIAFAKSEQSYHLTSTDAEAAAVRLLLLLHRKRHIPELYYIICIYVKWH